MSLPMREWTAEAPERAAGAGTETAAGARAARAATQSAAGSAPAGAREKLLEVKNLSVHFGRGRKKFVAVDNVSFDIYKGETLGLVGESGSGKTTIGRAIVRLVPVSGGEIYFKGERISGRISREQDRKLTQKIQMIFQDPMASLNERAKVDYIVSEGLYNTRNYSSEEERKQKVADALLSVGLLPEFASRFPHEFSGGQRQRIAIARAMILQPRFVVLDEPTSALDMSVQAQIVDLLRDLQQRYGLAYLFISHDLKVVRALANEVVVMRNGKVVEQGPATQIFSEPRTDYTRALIAAAFDIEVAPEGVVNQ